MTISAYAKAYPIVLKKVVYNLRTNEIYHLAELFLGKYRVGMYMFLHDKVFLVVV